MVGPAAQAAKNKARQMFFKNWWVSGTNSAFTKGGAGKQGREPSEQQHLQPEPHQLRRWHETEALATSYG